MAEKLDWWMSWRLSREMRDYLADCAFSHPEARGSASKMLRIMVDFFRLNSDTAPGGTKARADLARFARKARLDEISRLRQDYLELEENPNPEEEAAAQERARELGLEWPPKAYSESDLSTILLRLKRLWHTDSRSGSISLRDLNRSLHRRYNLDRLFECLKELQERNELLITKTRPIYIQEIPDAVTTM